MTTDEYIEWAQTTCPQPVASKPVSLQEAAEAYDDVDERLGDDAEGNDFLTRVMWLEIAIRLARVGWTILRLEEARGPASNTANVAFLMKSLER